VRHLVRCPLRMQNSIFLGFLVIISFALAADLTTSHEEAFLIVHKNIKSDLPGLYAVNKNFTVDIKVFNVGGSSAYEVKVSDIWPEGFKLAHGVFDHSWEEIPSKENRTYSLSIIPATEGRFVSTRAKVDYQPGTDASRIQTGYSTSLGNISVVSETLYNKYTATHKYEWTLFGIAAFCSIALPFAFYMYFRFEFPGGVPKPKQN